MAHGRLLTLDIVRGTAILLVLAFHFRQPLGVPLLDIVLQPVFAAGWIGVDLFFVLSGFLVGRIILEDASSSAGLDRRRFFQRRILRLWPVLLVYLATLLAIGGGNAWPMVWPVLLHVQNYSTVAPSHLWSLAVEEHFYLIAVFVIPLLLRRGGHVRVERWLVAVMITCLGARLVALAVGEPLLHLQWQTQYRLDAPAFGVLLASVALHRPALFAQLTGYRMVWLGVAVAGWSALAWAGDGAFRHGVGFTLAYLSSGAFILALINARIDGAVAPPARQIAAVGQIAYPLYIWHASIGAVVRALADQTTAVPGLVITVSIALAIAVAVAMHVLVERPFMRRRAPDAMTGTGAAALIA